MRIWIFSCRAFDRRLARLAAPISSVVRQGVRICPPAGRVRLNTPAGRGLKLKILSSKNRVGKFWNFGPWWPQFWPELKNVRNDFEIIFCELSNGVFCFVLRCAGAEIDGGCSNTPSPIIWFKIQRPIRARVKLLSKDQKKMFPCPFKKHVRQRCARLRSAFAS